MKGLSVELVVAQRIAAFVVLGVLSKKKQVGHADGIGLRVELLAVGREVDAWANSLRHFLGGGEESAGAGTAVVDAPDFALFAQDVLVWRHDELCGQVDDIARRVVFSRGLIGAFREFSDQMFKDKPHIAVGDDVGA